MLQMDCRGLICLVLQVIDPSVQGVDAVSMKANVGRLFMVDLAGSERLKKSMSVGAAVLLLIACYLSCLSEMTHSAAVARCHAVYSLVGDLERPGFRAYKQSPFMHCDLSFACVRLVE